MRSIWPRPLDRLRARARVAGATRSLAPRRPPHYPPPDVGLTIDRDHFEESDYARFAGRLRDGLAALRATLARPGFGEGPATIGAELELALVDVRARPLPLAREVLARTLDPRLTFELDRFNLECNGRPLRLAGRPFTALARELASALAEVRRAAAPLGGRAVAVGILPTLRLGDLERGAMTDLARYRALSAGIRRLRHAPFSVRIAGDDPLEVTCDDVTLEGANTSLQLHLRVAPREFARTHAAAQIASAPALAAAANAPLFLGHRLWEETRIALFKQAVDERSEPAGDWRPPARVSFGHGWCREGALELFAESVALHAPLLPVVGPEDPLEAERAGRAPRLDELRLHHGTVWRWNRAVYDPEGGGHLRLELRALPAGPTVTDMAANAAFLLGLTLGLAPRAEALLPSFPFEHAHRNFYRAAQHGLDAQLLWPAEEPPSPRPVRAGELVAGLLEIAREGLVAAGVEEDEAAHHLAVVDERVRSGRTGARWQRLALAAHERRGEPRDAALAALVEDYLRNAASEAPVHRWPEPA